MSARTVGLQTACSNTVSQRQVESMSQLLGQNIYKSPMYAMLCPPPMLWAAESPNQTKSPVTCIFSLCANP